MKSSLFLAVTSDLDALQIVRTDREPISSRKKIVKGNFRLRKATRKDRYQYQKAAFFAR